MASSKHFSEKELRCKCGCGDNLTKPELLEALERLRAAYGKPLKVNSGYRCRTYNDVIVKGHPNSAHKKGLAVDIAVANSVDRYRLLWHVMRLNEFQGVGVAEGFIHLDIKERFSKVQVLFTY
jgi:uncharacterized protein YcbK (DUF882 family)